MVTKRTAKVAIGAGGSRVFKTPDFAEDAKKAGIPDSDLCGIARELDQGLGDNLGGGVWKKRVLRNEYRTIVLNKVETWWVFQYLFAKNVVANIPEKRLRRYRQLAKDLAAATQADFDGLVTDGELLEICKHGKK